MAGVNFGVGESGFWGGRAELCKDFDFMRIYNAQHSVWENEKCVSKQANSSLGSYIDSQDRFVRRHGGVLIQGGPKKVSHYQIIKKLC